MKLFKKKTLNKKIKNFHIPQPFLGTLDRTILSSLTLKFSKLAIVQARPFAIVKNESVLSVRTVTGKILIKLVCLERFTKFMVCFNAYRSWNLKRIEDVSVPTSLNQENVSKREANENLRKKEKKKY